eukprot:m.77804 g.77804  ORF g.77804 m.77804 type:complete len:571 (+) comp9164_c0_seq1:117-1829(+)
MRCLSRSERPLPPTRCDIKVRVSPVARTMTLWTSTALLMSLACMADVGVKGTVPNVVVIIADDQDVLLGGETPIPQTRALVADAGVRLTNFMVATPVCCPSRTEFLTGRYMHNLLMGQGSARGHNCMNQNSTNVFNSNALFPTLHAAGIRTGHFGKLVNDQNYYWCPAKGDPIVTDGFAHISTSCESTGAFWATQYVVKDNDTAPVRWETLDATDPSTYSTAQFGNRSTAWIRDMATTGVPFFAYIGVMAPHLPAQPAPWHQDRYPNATSPSGDHPVRAPRTPSFNYHDPNRSHMLASAPELDAPVIQFVDQHMRNRWRSLLAVDDLVAAVIHTLDETGVLDNTFIFYTADHGYHLGQFRIPDEKTLPYDTDLRVPMYVRGPGIQPNTTLPALTGNVDLAPTVLDLMGVAIPTWMDGRSFAPLLRGTPVPQWRTEFLAQINIPEMLYFGMNKIYFRDTSDPVHGTLKTPPKTRADNDSAIFWYDDMDNTWRMLRILNDTHNVAYVEFGDFWPVWPGNHTGPPVPSEFELYDLSADPYQLHNLYGSTDAGVRTDLHMNLQRYFSCAGKSCP